MPADGTNSEQNAAFLRLLNIIRTDPRPMSPSADTLWSFYLPIRSTLVARVAHGKDQILPFRPPNYDYYLSFKISDMLQTLDALVIYTPDDSALERLRKHQLRKLLRPPLLQSGNSNNTNLTLPVNFEIRYDRLCQLVYLVQRGLMAAKTRAGSASASVVSSPGWLDFQAEYADPLVARLASEFTGLDVAVDSSSAAGAPDEDGDSIFSRLRPRFRHQPAAQIPRQTSSLSTDTAPVALPVAVDGVGVLTASDVSPEEQDDTPRTRRSSTSSTASIPHIGTQIKRDAHLINLTKQRDHHRCILTGSTPTDAAHIIPYSCANFSEYLYAHAYWHLTRILLGDSLTASLWAFVGAENVNRLENMLCLTSTAHKWYGMGKILLLPCQEAANNNYSNCLLMRYRTTEEFDTPVTRYPMVHLVEHTGSDDISVAGEGFFCKTWEQRELQPKRARVLEDQEVVVCYTDDMGEMPVPSPVLLKVAALMARLMGCVLLEQRKMGGAAAVRAAAAMGGDGDGDGYGDGDGNVEGKSEGRGGQDDDDAATTSTSRRSRRPTRRDQRSANTICEANKKMENMKKHLHPTQVSCFDTATSSVTRVSPASTSASNTLLITLHRATQHILELFNNRPAPPPLHEATTSIDKPRPGSTRSTFSSSSSSLSSSSSFSFSSAATSSSPSHLPPPGQRRVQDHQYSPHGPHTSHVATTSSAHPATREITTGTGLDISTLEKLLTPLATAQARKMRIPSREQIRRIRLVQRACMGDGGGEGDDESEWEEEGQGPDWVVREMVDWWVGA